VLVELGTAVLARASFEIASRERMRRSLKLTNNRGPRRSGPSFTTSNNIVQTTFSLEDTPPTGLAERLTNYVAWRKLVHALFVLSNDELVSKLRLLVVAAVAVLATVGADRQTATSSRNALRFLDALSSGPLLRCAMVAVAVARSVGRRRHLPNNKPIGQQTCVISVELNLETRRGPRLQ
jgi:hypothetical protein